MRLVLPLLLLALPALAGGKGSLRRAVSDAQDVVSDSDADCARKLGKKLAALEDAVADGESGRGLKRQVREVNDYAADACPRKLAGKVRRALEPLGESRDDDDDDDDRRSRRRSRDDDDEDEDRSSRRAPPRRDCGTGEDPGCVLARNGQAPMDAIAYRGFLAALDANGNEFTRLDIVKSTLANQTLTAQQLGPVLDGFRNEFLKLDAAKVAVPRLVNPQHALGHASKFQNTFLAADYSKLLASR